MKYFFLGIAFLAWMSIAAAQEIPVEGLKIELVKIQARIKRETLIYERAKADMERAELFSRYLLPKLKKRAGEIKKQLNLMEEVNSSQEDSE